MYIEYMYIEYIYFVNNAEMTKLLFQLYRDKTENANALHVLHTELKAKVMTTGT